VLTKEQAEDRHREEHERVRRAQPDGRPNASPNTDFLAGKSMTLRLDDGPVVEYKFDDAQTLHWRREGEQPWKEERYEAWESAPARRDVRHLLSGAPKHDKFTVVVDFDEGLATCIHGTGRHAVHRERDGRENFGSAWSRCRASRAEVPPSQLHRRASWVTR